MAPLYEKYSGNLDVTAIYVEALMNLKAALWDKNTATGEITPADDNTLLLVKIMEDAFASSEGKVPNLPPLLPPSNCLHSRKRLYQRQTFFVPECRIGSLGTHAITHRCMGWAVEGSNRL